MHPLSIEDLLHRRGHSRSKADYYPKHLFIRVLCHTLGSSRVSRESEKVTSSPAAWSSPAAITGLPRSSSPRFDDKLGIVNVDEYEDSYGNDNDQMDDVFESDRATLIDPEMGGRRASALV